MGAVLGAAAGAVTEHAAARWIDMGFPDEYFEYSSTRVLAEPRRAAPARNVDTRDLGRRGAS